MDSSSVPPLVKRVAHFGSRTVGRLSARHRMTPAFLIAGGQRCGTTSLHRALAQHPAILKAVLHKGVHYFDTDYFRGPEWYLAHFPLLRTARAVEERTGLPALTFESAPYYMYHPLAAERIAYDLPAAKVICLLRDPVERAYSQHAHEVARGYETETDFAKALALEPKRLEGEEERLRTHADYHSHTHQHHGYRARGRYVEYLDRLASELGRDRIHVVDSAEFFADPATVYEEVLEFLELPSLGEIRFEQANARPRSAPMPEPVRAELSDFFAPYDRRLADWLGHEPSWRQHPARHRSEPSTVDAAGPAEDEAALPTSPRPPEPFAPRSGAVQPMTVRSGPAEATPARALPARTEPEGPTGGDARASGRSGAPSLGDTVRRVAAELHRELIAEQAQRPWTEPPGGAAPVRDLVAPPVRGPIGEPASVVAAEPERGVAPVRGSIGEPASVVAAEPERGVAPVRGSIGEPAGVVAAEPERGVAPEPGQGLGAEPSRGSLSDPLTVAALDPPAERQRVVAVEPPRGLLFGAPRSRSTTGESGRGEINSHRGNGSGGSAATNEAPAERGTTADPGQPGAGASNGHGKRSARHGAASGRGRR